VCASAQDFERFWEAYPVKAGREKALRHWRALMPDAALVRTMLAAIAEQQRSDRWLRGFAPDPWRWISDRGWEDQLPAAPKAKAAAPPVAREELEGQTRRQRERAAREKAESEGRKP